MQPRHITPGLGSDPHEGQDQHFWGVEGGGSCSPGRLCGAPCTGLNSVPPNLCPWKLNVTLFGNGVSADVIS